ncbi:MAG: MFS transporter [Pseudomonadota bacterium]
MIALPRMMTPWRAVAAAFALNGFLLGNWAARVPAVMERHGLSEGAFGFQLLLMGVGALISFPIAGRMADRRGALPVTRVLTVFYLTTLVFIGLAPGVVALGFAVFVFGMCHGAMDVTMNAWATEVEKHLARPVMSSFHAMWSLGTGAGAALGYVATANGLDLAWHFALAPVLAAVFLGPFLGLPWQSETRQAQASDPAFALPRGPLILVGFFALSAALGEGATADWSAVYLRDTLGSTEAQATLGFAVFSVAMVGMRLCADQLVRRFGAVFIARTCALIAAIGIVLVTGLSSFPAALAGFFLMGVGYAPLVPLAFSRAAADRDVPPGQAIAAVATLGYGALLLGPPVIGQIAEISSLRLGLALLGAFAFAVALLAPVLAPATNTKDAAAAD